MSEQTEESGIVLKDTSSGEPVVTCTSCGVLVAKTDEAIQAHAQFHGRLAAKEIAKAVQAQLNSDLARA